MMPSALVPNNKTHYSLLLSLLACAVVLVTVFNLLQSDIRTTSKQKQIKKIIDNAQITGASLLSTAAPPRLHIIKYDLKPLSYDLFRSLPVHNSNNNHPPKVSTALVSKPNKTQYQHCILSLSRTSSEFKDIAWYQHLDEYGVELQWLSIKDGQRFISHPINQRFMIYPSLKTVEYFLCTTASGYGNGLSVYWGARSLAYWMNFNFKIGCRSYWNNLQKNKLMSAFLPSSIAMNASGNMDNKTHANKSVLTFYPKLNRIPSQNYVIHSTSLLFMYYNPHFQQIMNYETVHALHEYYHHMQHNQTILEMDAMKDTNDVVIHIRCGDVLQIMHRVKDWDYGFLTMNHYKYVMTIGLEKAFGINWYHKLTQNTTVFILSQLTHNAARKGELGALKDCDYLVNYLVDHGLRDLFAPATVKIIYDSDVNDDYYRMLMAPLLFCSPSTYCLNAGIANTNGIVVIPNRGAWLNFFHLMGKNRTMYDEDGEDFIVIRNSSLIPKNQLIVDTEKAGWHCNKIDVKSKYNQKEYTHKLAEYLVSH